MGLRKTTKRIDDIEVARAEAYTVDFYINHLIKKDFQEVRGEYRDGHPEELLDIAVSIIFARGNNRLKSDIIHGINYIKFSYVETHNIKRRA